MRVAELEPSERPREKLLQRGANAPSDAELLAILLRTGAPGVDVLEMARIWLDEVGGLAGLASLDTAAILGRKGVGQAKACAIAAALEIGRRLARQQLEGRDLLDRPEATAEFLRRTYAFERVELFGVLTLDARHRLLRVRVLHRGSRAWADVEPSEVFHAAIIDNAHAVIVWHTHPSGDATPSDDDIALTRRLAETGALLRLDVLDHLVIGRDGWVSLRLRGVLPVRKP